MENKLTNLQMELLKLFSFQLNEDVLNDIKRVLKDYFANKMINLANNEWESRKYSNETMDNWIFGENQ